MFESGPGSSVRRVRFESAEGSVCCDRPCLNNGEAGAGKAAGQRHEAGEVEAAPLSKVRLEIEILALSDLEARRRARRISRRFTAECRMSGDDAQRAQTREVTVERDECVGIHGHGARRLDGIRELQPERSSYPGGTLGDRCGQIDDEPRFEDMAVPPCQRLVICRDRIRSAGREEPCEQKQVIARFGPLQLPGFACVVDRIAPSSCGERRGGRATVTPRGGANAHERTEVRSAARAFGNLAPRCTASGAGHRSSMKKRKSSSSFETRAISSDRLSSMAR